MRTKSLKRKLSNIILLGILLVIAIGIYYNIYNSRAENIVELVAIAHDNYGYLESEEFKLEAKELEDDSYEIELPETVNSKQINQILQVTLEEKQTEDENVVQEEIVVENTSEDVSDQEATEENTTSEETTTETANTEEAEGQILEETEGQTLEENVIEIIDNKITLSKEQIENKQLNIEVTYYVTILGKNEQGEITKDTLSEKTTEEIQQIQITEETQVLYNTILRYEDEGKGKLVEVKGNLPEKVQLKVEEVSQEELVEIFGSKQIDVAYDITLIIETTKEVLIDPEDPEKGTTQITETIEVNPEEFDETCEVTIKDANIQTKSQVYHVKEDNTYETVEVKENTEENITFKATTFSTYAVAAAAEATTLSSTPVGTTVTAADIQPGDYGAYVEYEVTNTTCTPSQLYYGIDGTAEGEEIGWRIFYADEEHIYIIADDYIHKDYIPDGEDGTEVSRGGSKANASLDPYVDYGNGIAEINEDIREKWLSIYMEYLEDYYSSTSYWNDVYNQWILGYLYDTKNRVWGSLGNAEVSEYVLGVPPLEMFVKSYNATHPDNTISLRVQDLGGYQKKWSDKNWGSAPNYISDVDPYYQYSDTKGLYVIEDDTRADALWLGGNTPQASSAVHTMHSDGRLWWNTYENKKGFRPVIALKSDVTLTRTEDGFVEDGTPPELSSINVTSPAAGTYTAGQTVTIVATYNENITATTIPTLKIKFGNGTERTATAGNISGNTITYTYTIVSGDNGKLATTSYSGTVTDMVGNALSVSNKTIGGNAITADTTAPTLSSISVEAPEAGTYTVGQTVTIIATYNENIKATTKPTLKIKFGDGDEKTATAVLVQGTLIGYIYTIESGDNGVLATTSYSGTVTDMAGNALSVSNKTISGNQIIADTTAPKLSSIEVTSPDTETYTVGQVVTIVTTYDENVYGDASKATITASTAPTIKIKFGSSDERTITFSSVSENTITYTYTIARGDNGTLATTGYSGTVYDALGNSGSQLNKTIGGNTITADTMPPRITVTPATQETAVKNLQISVNIAEENLAGATGLDEDSIIYKYIFTDDPYAYTSSDIQEIGEDFTLNTPIVIDEDLTGAMYLVLALPKDNIGNQYPQNENNGAYGESEEGLTAIFGPYQLDNSAPTITVSEPGAYEEISSLDWLITFSDQGVSGISQSSNFSYYMSTSSTTLEGGEWVSINDEIIWRPGQEWQNGNYQELFEHLEGTKYIFVPVIQDNLGHVSSAEGTIVTIDGNNYHRFGPYIFGQIETQLLSLSVINPETGTYKAGQEITIVAQYNESIYSDASQGSIGLSTAPTLKIRFGTGTERTATFESVSGNAITYTYTIVDGDNGVLETTNYSGTVYDKTGNALTVSSQELTGNVITADTNAPKCIITVDQSHSSSGRTTYIFTFDEKVVGFEIDDITVENGTKEQLLAAARKRNCRRNYI